MRRAGGGQARVPAGPVRGNGTAAGRPVRARHRDRRGAGVGLGVLSTAVYASTKGWTVVAPTVAWTGGPGSAVLIGAVAGFLPALRAARMSPTEALCTV